MRLRSQQSTVVVAPTVLICPAKLTQQFAHIVGQVAVIGIGVAQRKTDCVGRAWRFHPIAAIALP